MNNIREANTFELAGELGTRLLDDKSRWKYPWMKEICELCAEYLTLDGLKDATLSANIPDMILDIAEKASAGTYEA